MTDKKPDIQTAVETEIPDPALKQTYFFPDGPFSCQATSLEEATKQFEQHKKGAVQETV